MHGGNDTTPRLDAEIAIRTGTGRNDYQFSLAFAHPDQLLFTKEAFRYSRDDFDTEAAWNYLDSGHREARIVEVGQAHGVGALGSSAQTARTVTYLLRNCRAFQFPQYRYHVQLQEILGRSRSRLHANRQAAIWLLSSTGSNERICTVTTSSAAKFSECCRVLTASRLRSSMGKWPCGGDRSFRTKPTVLISRRTARCVSSLSPHC